MGPIYNRTREHLGTTDALIIRTRRRMIAAPRRSRARHRPPGVETPAGLPPALRRHRPAGSVDWWESTRELREKFEAGRQQVGVSAS